MKLTDQDVERAAESLGLGAAKSLRRVYFEYVWSFETIASGGSLSVTRQINKGGAFVAQAIKGAVWLPTAGTAAAYSPFYWGQPSATEASLTWESLFATRLDIRTVDTNWFSEPVRGGLVLGDAMNPFYLPTTRPIAENEEVNITLFNDSQQSMAGQIVMAGYKLIR